MATHLTQRALVGPDQGQQAVVVVAGHLDPPDGQAHPLGQGVQHVLLQQEEEVKEELAVLEAPDLLVLVVDEPEHHVEGLRGGLPDLDLLLGLVLEVALPIKLGLV